MTGTGRPLAGLRVLAVEDEAMLAMALEDMLSGLGASVLGPAGSVAKALALIEREGPAVDGAVLDVHLGVESAYPVADALAARGVPFLFLTGYDPAGIDARHQGVPVLTKPVDAGALERVLRKLQRT